MYVKRVWVTTLFLLQNNVKETTPFIFVSRWSFLEKLFNPSTVSSDQEEAGKKKECFMAIKTNAYGSESGSVISYMGVNQSAKNKFTGSPKAARNFGKSVLENLLDEQTVLCRTTV